MTGALLHVVFHAGVKCALFLTAGIFIFRTGKTRVEEYMGIGKNMQVTLWRNTYASLALIGIPPFNGFISKWYLAQGALQSDTGIFRIAGPVVLLLSALLTAGYLLPITIKGFLPGENFALMERKEAEDCRREKLDIMSAALFALTVVTILIGLFPGPLIQYASEIASSVM